MAAMGEAVIKGRIELDNAVVVRPGDKLIVGVSQMITHAIADTIKDRLADELPGVEIVLIDMCSSLAVYRDDEPPWKKDAERRKQARIDGTWQP